MSELIILRNLVKNYPLIVASNEEDASTNKCNIENIKKNIIGRANSTSCLLVNHASIFATYTTQGISEGKSPNKLIIELLKKSSIVEILQYLKIIDTSEYVKMNLIFGDKDKVFIAYSYFCNRFICIEIKGNESIFTQDINFTSNSASFNKNSRIHHKISSIRYDLKVNWNNTYKFIKELLRTTKVKKLTRFSTILAFKKSGLSKYKAIDRTKEKVYKDYYNQFINGNSITEEDKEIEEDEPENIVSNQIQEVIETLPG
jgi:hypothetical protein